VVGRADGDDRPLVRLAVFATDEPEWETFLVLATWIGETVRMACDGSLRLFAADGFSFWDWIVLSLTLGRVCGPVEARPRQWSCWSTGVGER
jgi:hypothetical protein